MRRTALALTTALVALPLLALPGWARTEITLSTQQEPTVLDPTADATASIDSMLTQNVYESLTSVNEAGEVIPALATDWTVSEDGLTYTFTLASGVTFHDGTAFDAEDVLFSFDRAMAEDSTNPSKRIFEPITEITAPDAQTVVITLDHTDAFFLFNLAQGDASIVAPESVDGNATSPVGTGPFRFDSWTRGDRLTLVRNDDYRDLQDGMMERITFRFIADPTAVTNALMAGEIDGTAGFPSPELLPMFESDPRFTVAVGTTQGEVILALNNGRAPFNDIDARRAVNHGLNRQEIIDGAMYGYATPIGSFFPPSDANYVDLTGLYPFDPEVARSLLADAGIAEGTSIRLRIPPFAYATRSAVIIQAEMAAIGLDVEVEQLEWAAWMDQVYNGRDYEMTIIAHTSPNDLSNFTRGPNYFYGYDNPAFNTLWDQIVATADPVARGALLQDAQRFVADEAVHGFLFQLPSLGVYRTELSGYWVSSPVIFSPLADLRWTE
ncbi:ABC transporter substrate-binding protein [Cereibacter sphaeroides]|nr:ABC transporter substrate-binding protein [Cereibacter sphaeroides]